MKEQIKAMYLKGETKRNIIKKFNLGNYTRLNYILNELGVLKEKTNNNKIEINDDIFDSIDTEEKAYLLGFLSSDGYILNDGRTIGISLKREDKYILERFKEILEYKGEIKDYDAVTTYGQASYSRLRFSSYKIYNFLKDFGFTNKKSYSFKPKTELINPEFYRDFLRGYFDGNCSIIIRIDKNNIKRYQVSILGLKNIIDLFTDYFEFEKEYYLDQRKEGCETLNIKFQKMNLVDKVLDGLYKDSNIYLKRKYERYINFKNTTYKKVVHI